MSDIILFSVYGSTNHVAEALSTKGYTSQVTVIPPMKVLSGAHNVTLQPVNEDIKVEQLFDQDICFIESKGLDIEYLNTMIKDCGLEPVPVNITIVGEDGENTVLNDEEEFFLTMEEEILNTDEHDYHFPRYNDILHRINDGNSKRNDPTESVVACYAKGKLLEKMIPQGASSAVIAVKLPVLEVSEYDDNTYTQMTPVVDSDIDNIFYVLRTNGYDSEATLDENGEYLVVTDIDAFMMMESLMPCVITVIGIYGDESEHDIAKTWIIYGDSIDGTSDDVTDFILDELEDDEWDAVGVDIDLVQSQYAADIPCSQYSILSPLEIGGDLIDIIENALED